MTTKSVLLTKGILLALLTLLLSGSLVWTIPIAQQQLPHTLAVCLLVLQGGLSALTATQAGRQLARAYPKRPR